MIDFPANPTVGQTFTSAGVTWTWDGIKWTFGGTVGPPVTVAPAAPSGALPGALWWDSVGGQLYLYFNDGTSSQWVIVTNITGAQGPQGPAGPQGATGPAGATGPQGATGPGTNENRIINGDMRIDQRNNGASGTGGGYTIDRWQYNANQTAKGSWQRVSSGGLAGFPYALAFASSSAYTPAAGDLFEFLQAIEADMVSDFAWGTSNAQPVTISFWAQSSLTGTFSGSIRGGGGRSYPFTYSLPTANIWTKFAITIPGDTGGTWVLSGNAVGVSVGFSLGAGSTYTAPGNAWGASGNGTHATGSVNVVSTNGATFYLTGVKLEIGSVATPFNRPTMQKSLADCQRYYQAFSALGNTSWAGSAGQNFWTALTLMATMRAVPTLTVAGSAFGNSSGGAITASSSSSVYITATATAIGGATWNAAITASAEL